MTVELLEALAAILRVCENENSCTKCPLKEYCGKMPCDW